MIFNFQWCCCFVKLACFRESQFSVCVSTKWLYYSFDAKGCLNFAVGRIRLLFILLVEHLIVGGNFQV